MCVCVCVCDCVDAVVIVWVCVGVIAWVRVCGWAALIAAAKYDIVCVCVLGGSKGEGGVCVWMCGCGCDCVGMCGCDCMGEEGSMWVEQP